MNEKYNWAGSGNLMEAPAELWPSVLAGYVTLEVKPSMDPGGYVKEMSFVVWSDEPMADHKIDDHWMRWLRPRKRVECLEGETHPRRSSL